MSYQEKFVAVVKTNGKILREHDNVVTIPFGVEYSILLKNLNSVKAVVNVSIDGQDVLSGNQIIVYPNQSLELEGFMKGSTVSNKFKFIQKTKEIQDYRGDKVDDGMIRVEYKFEQVVTKEVHYVENVPIYNRPWPYYPPYLYYPTYPWTFYGSVGRGLNSSGSVTSSLGGTTASNSVGDNVNFTSSLGKSDGMVGASLNEVNCFNNSEHLSAPLQDEGITVKGGQSNQNFQYGYTNQLEETSNVIVLRLRGINSKGEPVKESIEVDKKIICGICGRSNKSSSKFCSNCGSSLI
jgi:hypothetical protein